MMSAYSDAVKMLARRELSEAQIRQRLARRQHPAAAIDSAVDRLRELGAIDDERVAEAIARTQIATKRRGELRARQEILRAGISRDTAQRVAREVSQSVGPEAVLEAALTRRLRGRDQIADEREYARLHRYLIGQGFEPDRVLSALKKHGGRKGR